MNERIRLWLSRDMDTQRRRTSQFEPTVLRPVAQEAVLRDGFRGLFLLTSEMIVFGPQDLDTNLRLHIQENSSDTASRNPSTLMRSPSFIESLFKILYPPGKRLLESC